MIPRTRKCPKIYEKILPFNDDSDGRLFILYQQG